MSIDLSPLAGQTRLLMEVALQPIQGSRFQPTGFPDLGAAAYDAPNEQGGVRQLVLVESAQSIANRLEAVCWDEVTDAPHAAIDGVPYVSVRLGNSGTTNSLLEAHRLNSPYIMRNEDFKERLRECAELPHKDAAGTFNRSSLARTVFRYDPGSLLHGVFLEKLDGRARLQRCLSGFIEAQDTRTADSGGVKNDRVAPSPKALKQLGLSVGAQEGFGNVPFHRTEYTAKRIVAYFSLDLAQIRAYRLGDDAEQFLVLLALWKVRRFLDIGLRLRTACDLDPVDDIKVTRPRDGFTVPITAELEEALAPVIVACTNQDLFASPHVTDLELQTSK